MSKSKKSFSNLTPEKLLQQIQKELEEKNFESIEEANDYIKSNYTFKEVNLNKKKVSNIIEAIDLIEEAWEIENRNEKILLAEKAIKIDVNCTEAYILLAEIKAETPLESVEYYEKGIQAAKTSLGEDYEKFKGHFWGFHETRPFMRAMAGYSESLWYLNEENKSIDVLQEMLELNPNDNQGMRTILVTRLLILNRFLEAEKLIHDFGDEKTASMLYGKAYLYFNKRSKKLEADKILIKAMEYNPYVPLYLLGLIHMPDELPDYIGFGDESEAISYVELSMLLWAKNEKAIRWFIELYEKMEKKLIRIIEKKEKENFERFQRFSGK